MEKRKYRLRERANQQQQTRERIVEAAVALHEELGPAATTISALAEKAGVQRLTVYRHFADDRALFQACSSKWLGRNPPPDAAEIELTAAAERTRALLGALYAYYARTQGMWTSLYRDLGTVEALDAPMAEFDAYLASLQKDLLKAWAPRKSKRLAATITHALQFATWQSLAAQRLGREAIADLVCTWIGAAAA